MIRRRFFVFGESTSNQKNVMTFELSQISQGQKNLLKAVQLLLHRDSLHSYVQFLFSSKELFIKEKNDALGK